MCMTTLKRIIFMNKIIDFLKNNLKESRYVHTMGVREEAINLAKHYGADQGKAELAALIHDCCKNKSVDELVSIANQLNLPLDEMQLDSTALLHGPVGAAFAKDYFKIDNPEVIDAVACHTTGKADMTLLDKIIYLADYIEPNRESFEGLDELREIAYVDLDKAMLKALNMSVKHVKSKGATVHPDTLSAIKYFSK